MAPIQYQPHKPHKNYVLVPWRMRAVSEFQETQLALLVPLVACKPKLLVIVQCHGCLLMAPHKGSNQCLKASQLLRQIWAPNGDLGWDWQTEDPILHKLAIQIWIHQIWQLASHTFPIICRFVSDKLAMVLWIPKNPPNCFSCYSPFNLNSIQAKVLPWYRTQRLLRVVLDQYPGW